MKWRMLHAHLLEVARTHTIHTAHAQIVYRLACCTKKQIKQGTAYPWSPMNVIMVLCARPLLSSASRTTPSWESMKVMTA